MCHPLGINKINFCTCASLASSNSANSSFPNIWINACTYNKLSTMHRRWGFITFVLWRFVFMSRIDCHTEDKEGMEWEVQTEKVVGVCSWHLLGWKSFVSAKKLSLQVLFLSFKKNIFCIFFLYIYRRGILLC